MTSSEKIRNAILEAAKERFDHFGYGKTTMAELARDCKMSPGNLYRYFPGKLDIAEAIGRDANEATVETLREIVQKQDLNAVEKLKAFHHRQLEFTYGILEETPQAYELATIISHERPEFANDMLEKERALLVEILAAGNASREFRVADVVFTAEMIQSATLKFRFPQLWSRLPLDQLKRELNGVLDLFLTGICGGGAAGATNAA